MKNSTTPNISSLPFIRPRAVFAALALFVCFLAAHNSASAANYVVTRVDDRNNATCAAGDCSLREAVKTANATAADDTISFNIPAASCDASTNVCTITLTTASGGEIAINSAGGALTINGTGANLLTIDGGAGLNRIFIVSDATVTIQGVTLSGGYGGGGAVLADGGTTILDAIVVQNNRGDNGSGPVIFVFGTNHLISNSTISGNTNNFSGCAAIVANSTTSFTVVNTTISGNASTGGGGIGAICIINATATFRNTTIFGNTAFAASGSAGGGGGIFIDVSSTVNLGNTIVAGNSSQRGPDLFRFDSASTFTTSGYNLIGDNSGSTTDPNTTTFPTGTQPNGDQVGTTGSVINPLLGALQNNGGTTPTQALLFGSPALDTGNSFGFATDQRGFLRPVDLPSVPNGSGDFADIGAYEAQTAPQPPMADLSVSKSDSPDPVTAGTNLTYTINLTNNGPDTANTVSFTDTIPANTTFVSFNQNTGPIFSCPTPSVGSTGDINCSIASLAAGTSAQFTLVVNVNISTPANTVISNTVNASTATLDSTSGNNTATATTTVVIPDPMSFTVTRSDDRNVACLVDDCSLREAVNAANTSASNDTINFASSVTNITLTNQIVINNAGTLTIAGPGANVLTIDGGPGTNRIFLLSRVIATITRVTLTGGNGVAGGAIRVEEGSLTLDGVHVTGNTASSGGGGGVFFSNGTDHQILNSTFSRNTAGFCGGFENVGTLNVINSTISGNTATGTVTGAGGGGLCNAGTMTLQSVTVTNNSAASTTGGGGIFQFNGTNLNLSNTIVAGNTASINPDFKITRGTVTTSGYNLIGINSNVEATFPAGNPNANNDIVGTSDAPVDPMLEALDDNGGTTPTHELMSTSPAIDTGFSFGSTTDQRGSTRPADNLNITNATDGDGADIGAFELQLTLTAASVSISGRATTTRGRGIGGVRITLTDSSGNVRTATTSSFGYYRFADVAAGETYVLTAKGKRFMFNQPTQVVNADADIADANFIAY